MRCARVLVLLTFITVCWAQQVANTEELPGQQVAVRRRRVSDLADAEGEDGDVAAPADEGDEERLPTPNRPSRPRNPNRRRRKRKRIPPPRPLYEDYEDTLAFPTTGERPGGGDDVDDDHERPREPPTGPEHRSLPHHGDRRRLRDDEDDHRPLRRDRGGRPPVPDREGQPSIQRPYREQPYLVGEDGVPRPQRPLRRRRKNRRRPPIAAIGPPEGISEDPVADSELPPEDILANQEKDATPEHDLSTPPSDESEPGRRTEGRNGQIEDIPLGSLRGEVRLPTPPRQKHHPPPPVVTESGAEAEIEVTRRPQTTPESLPAENLPSFNFDNQQPRQRRRKQRPHGYHNRTTTTSTTTTSTTERTPVVVATPPDEMLADREPLRPREGTPDVPREGDDKDDDSFSAATSGNDDDDDARETSIVSGDITLQTTPIKISLSDLLREKNISIEEILKDADDEPPPSLPPRFQRPLRPRPPPPTPKTIVTPKLTQLSRVHQFLQKPKLGQGKEDDSKTDSESKKVQDAVTTSTSTHRAYTQTAPSTHRTNPPTTTTTTTTTTQRKYAPTTLSTQRFHTTSTARASIPTTTAREGITRRTSTTTTERVVGRPVGFGARAPAPLNMQETEDIDPVKMTGRQPAPSRGGNNTKAAEFLKSRVRLPPSSVLFPSVKARGGGQAPPSAPDREPLPTRVIDDARRAPKGPKSTPEPPPNTESNKIPGPVVESDAVLAHTHVPVYVLNPKYYKASQPKPEARPALTLAPTETNVLPGTERAATRAADTRSSSTTEGFGDAQMVTDAEPVRLNIPLKAGGEGDASGSEPSRGKSAEDEIVELLETENGSSRLSRILASRNMTLSELIEHRERGASQQHISDIFLRNEESKATPSVHAEETSTEMATTTSVDGVPKVEGVRVVQNNPAKKLNVEIVEEEEDGDEEGGENSKRVPRVFEGLAPFRPKAEPAPELELTDASYPESVVEVGTDLAIGANGGHENPGRVREVVTRLSDDDQDPGGFAGLPGGTRSAILASSALLGLAVFIFLAIFVACRVRRRRGVRRRHANMSPILCRDAEKSRSMTPVLRHSGYKDMTEERRYYLWNTIRKTLRYK